MHNTLVQNSPVNQIYSKLQQNKENETFQASNKLTQQSCRNLYEILKSPYLKSLWLNACEIQTKDLKFGLKLKFTSLKILDLGYNKIGCEGIKLLVKMDIINLQKLQLWSCEIGNEGAKHLVKGMWPNLFHINISDNNIRKEGVSSFLDFNWKKINYIMFFHNQGDAIGLLESVCVPLRKFSLQLDYQKLENHPLIKKSLIDRDALDYLNMTPQ